MTTESEREAYLKEHLTCELLMLRYTFARLSQPQYQLEWNAYYESFALHARTLFEFLTCEKDARNFKASDFCEFKAKKDDDTNGSFFRLHAGVFHLGKDRTDNKAGIEIAQIIMQWVEQNFQVFLTKLSPQYRSCWSEDKATLPTYIETLSIDSLTRPEATNVVYSTTSAVNRDISAS
jgi:hypothetical protein